MSDPRVDRKMNPEKEGNEGPVKNIWTETKENRKNTPSSGIDIAAEKLKEGGRAAKDGLGSAAHTVKGGYDTAAGKVGSGFTSSGEFLSRKMEGAEEKIGAGVEHVAEKTVDGFKCAGNKIDGIVHPPKETKIQKEMNDLSAANDPKIKEKFIDPVTDKLGDAKDYAKEKTGVGKPA